MKNLRLLLAIFAVFAIGQSAIAGGTLGGKEKSKTQKAIGAQLPQEMMHNGADVGLIQSAEAAYAEEMDAQQETPEHIQNSTSPETMERPSAQTHAALKMDRATRKEVKRNFRSNKKEIRKEIRKAKDAQKNSPDSDAELLLLVILAILLPPLAVFLYEGIGTNFWIDLILTLFFWLPGVIYALIVILAD